MSGSTVLIVDDERTLARAVKGFLTESGYEAELGWVRGPRCGFGCRRGTRHERLDRVDRGRRADAGPGGEGLPHGVGVRGRARVGEGTTVRIRLPARHSA